MAFHSISTPDYQPILVGMHKIVIQKELPDGMHELSLTMSNDIWFLCLPAGMNVFHDVIKDIW